MQSVPLTGSERHLVAQGTLQLVTAAAYAPKGAGAGVSRLFAKASRTSTRPVHFVLLNDMLLIAKQPMQHERAREELDSKARLKVVDYAARLALNVETVQLDDGATFAQPSPLINTSYKYESLS